LWKNPPEPGEVLMIHALRQWFVVPRGRTSRMSEPAAVRLPFGSPRGRADGQPRRLVWRPKTDDCCERSVWGTVDTRFFCRMSKINVENVDCHGILRPDREQLVSLVLAATAQCTLRMVVPASGSA